MTEGEGKIERYESEHSEFDASEQKGRSLFADAIERLRKRKLAMVCFWVIVIYFSLAAVIFIAEVTGYDDKIAIFNHDEKIDIEYQPPSFKSIHHIFGTDYLGDSVLRKTLYGAKTSITVALFASVLSIVIGVPLGAIAGYFRGFIDEIIVWIYSTLSNIPYIILILAFAVVLRDRELLGIKLSGITSVYLAMGLTGWVGICRLIRGEIIKRKESEYVLAARSYGCSGVRIVFRHLLPNVSHIIIIYFSLRFVTFIHAEVILSFLGLGENNKPSWGAMINDARIELPRDVWWQMAAATIAIFIISLALNIFGDALRDSLDPKLRSERT